VCGTPGYVAPEVLTQERYGKECDYWSVACVAYVMLSGNMPFFDEDNLKLFMKVKNAEYDFNDKSWENVSKQAK
jgi:calcium/calmodulin-dependent protein kinase I